MRKLGVLLNACIIAHHGGFTAGHDNVPIALEN